MQYDTLQNLCHRFPPEDLKKQYLRLLSGLSLAPDVPTPDFLNRVQQIGQLGLIYVCYDDHGLVGTATLIYEPKILRGLGIVGHIEDVVVCEQYRGRGITSRLVQHLKELAGQRCYKVILNCSPENEDFYRRNGFHVHGKEMAHYF
jgi:glucosamine-phosphate N-acetyltransferase